MRKILLVILALLFFIGSVSALTWTSAGGCWTAINGNYNLTMWNATGLSTWTVPAGISPVQYLVVAGGGGGASDVATGIGGAGGGAGGMLVNSTGSGLTVTPGSVLWVAVGAGGAGTTGRTTPGVNGANSSFANTTTGNGIQANGGGGGGTYSSAAGNGGSGGGQGSTTSSRTAYGYGVSGQGYNGGWNIYVSTNLGAAGGGGAGAIGGNTTSGSGGNGGTGLQSNITGTLTYYAGGGGGMYYSSGSMGSGGSGGGGSGGSTGGAGTNGLGGGGGGGYQGSYGGNGGSGVVIIEYSITGGTPLISNFIANQTTYTDYPMAVQFTDTSTGSPVTWNWTFGDTYTSVLQNPFHVYTVAGNYTVGLNVTNSTGGFSVSKSYINLTSDVDSNVVSWMHLNQSPIIDMQGNAWTMNGATVSATTYKFGGGSLSIQGNEQYISSASANTWNFGSGPAELEFWIYPTAVGNARNIISRTSSNGGGTTGGWGFYNGGTDATYGFWMGAFANETSTFTIPENAWSHIVIAIPASGLVQVYDNGAYVANMTRPVGSYDTTNPIVLGQGSSNGNPFYYLDEFRMSTGTQRFTMNPFSPPYAQYNGNLYPMYPNINANATLLYNSYPNNASTIFNVTAPHVRTVQIQNVTNCTSITASLTFPPAFENVIGNPVVNSTGVTQFPDLQVTGTSVDNTNGIVTFTVSRSGGGGINSTFLNCTSLVDTTFNYYNYTTGSSFNTYYANATITDGQHGVTYPIINFYATPVPIGTWTIYTAFAANATVVPPGAAVRFTDLSLGEPSGWTQWSWTFGDGGTSTSQNPTYAYASPGLYTVAMTSSLIANASVTNTTTKVSYINVTSAPPVAPVASFTSSFTQILPGGSVQFNDTSTNSPTSWTWAFGDGSGNSNQNPIHIYTSLGNYTVNLTATNAAGSNTISKTNYIQVVSSISRFTRQDIVMAPEYTLTVNFVDSSTNLPIPAVSVLDSNGNNATITTGTYVGTYPYSTVIIYATSSGYTSTSASYVVTGNLVETVQMTKSTTSSNTALNLLYPQQVQFQILDSYGNYLTNVSVTATMINSVANNTNWLSTLFAISSSATPVNSTVLYGTTDSQGTVAFPMIQSAEYQLTFVSSSWGVNSVKTVSPIQNSYMWILPDSMTSQVTQMGSVLSYKLSTYPPASSYPSTIYLEGNYSDSQSETTSINFYFTDYYGNHLYNLTINNPVGNVSAQYAVTNIAGSQYRWGFNASTQQFGYVEQDSGIMLQGNPINGTSSNLFNKSCTDWACDNAGYGY